MSPHDSLEPAVTLWLAYAFISVAISGGLLVVSYVWPSALPAARLSEVSPRALPAEVERLSEKKGLEISKEDLDDVTSEVKTKEKQLKAPNPRLEWMRWTCLASGAAVIVIGWVLFGLGVEWGVHGNVIAGTVGW